MERQRWIAFFSQTGSEIANISEELGREPDLIITNKDPLKCQDVDQRINKMYHLPNKPTVEDYKEVLSLFKNPVITLHGYLRILPEEICNSYFIFNGHPGLITEYPELKGKDPQIRTFEGGYPSAGAVLHRVIPAVDEGRVLLEERFSTKGLDLDGLFRTLKERSLSMWVKFLKTVL